MSKQIWGTSQWKLCQTLKCMFTYLVNLLSYKTLRIICTKRENILEKILACVNVFEFLCWKCKNVVVTLKNIFSNFFPCTVFFKESYLNYFGAISQCEKLNSVKRSIMLFGLTALFPCDMFGGNSEMNHAVNICNFTLQNMTGCRVVSNSMVSIFILNWKRASLNTRIWQRDT